MERVFEELRGYLVGWKGYFRRAETPGVFRDLDEWIRHRLRLVQLRQWKRGPTIYREMKRLGANEDAAREVAANSRRWIGSRKRRGRSTGRLLAGASAPTGVVLARPGRRPSRAALSGPAVTARALAVIPVPWGTSPP